MLSTKLDDIALYETLSETQRKAWDKVEAIAGEVEAAVAEWLQAKGLTSTTAKHIWLESDLETYSLREGAAPRDDKRPDHLKGIPLTICQFRLPGVVIRFREGPEERFARLKRNPKAGEMEAFIASLNRG